MLIKNNKTYKVIKNYGKAGYLYIVRTMMFTMIFGNLSQKKYNLQNLKST